MEWTLARRCGATTPSYPKQIRLFIKSDRFINIECNQPNRGKQRMWKLINFMWKLANELHFLWNFFIQQRQVYEFIDIFW